MTTIKALPVVLTVETFQDDLIASVVFRNNSRDIMFMDPIALCIDGAMTSNVFSIYDEKKRLVPYSGRQASLPPDMFFKIKPREIIRTKIAVNRGYKLIKGDKYLVQYLAFNPKYEDKVQRAGMVSNRVEVIY